MFKVTGFFAGLAIGCAFGLTCVAGQRMKWGDVPKPVQDTILLNGGKASSVDKESDSTDGKAVYEASVMGKDGIVRDLVITEDGKLVEVKTDDAADTAAERGANAQQIKANVTFSHPLNITNSYLPLASLKQDILEGTEGGKQVRIERTRMADLHKTFKIGEQSVEALVIEDREFRDGALAEVAIDYFAQDDNGTVHYLGEEVDEYKNGKVVGHEGSWMVGKDTQVPGVVIPANPKVGDKFHSEDVSQEIHENDEVVSVSEIVTVPTGTYQKCVKVEERLADGSTEYKYYARGVGVVREVPSNGDVLLKSHATTTGK